MTEKHDSSDTGYMSAWELEFEQDEKYDGVWDAAGKIFDKEGLSGLYHGVGWDTIGTVSGNIWYFMVCKCYLGSIVAENRADIDGC